MLVIKPLQTTRHKQRFFRINFQCVVPCLREQFKLLSWREEKRDENIVVAEKEEGPEQLKQDLEELQLQDQSRCSLSWLWAESRWNHSLNLGFAWLFSWLLWLVSGLLVNRFFWKEGNVLLINIWCFPFGFFLASVFRPYNRFSADVPWWG